LKPTKTSHVIAKSISTVKTFDKVVYAPICLIGFWGTLEVLRKAISMLFFNSVKTKII